MLCSFLKSVVYLVFIIIKCKDPINVVDSGIFLFPFFFEKLIRFVLHAVWKMQTPAAISALLFSSECTNDLCMQAPYLQSERFISALLFAFLPAYGSSRCLSIWLIQMPQLTAHPDASAYGSSRCLSLRLIQMPQRMAHPDASAYGSSRCLSLRLIQMPQCMAHPDASAIAYNSSFFLLVEKRSNYSLLLSLSIVLPEALPSERHAFFS